MTDLERKQAEEIARLKATIRTYQLKQEEKTTKVAVSWMTRNENGIAVNLFAAESIIASTWDMFLAVPAARSERLRPLIDRALQIADDLNSVNVIIADHLSKEITPAQYNSLIIDTIRVLDTMGGKITHCSTCIHAIEHKTKIKQELAKQRGEQ